MKTNILYRFHNIVLHDILYRALFLIHNIRSYYLKKKYEKIDPINDYDEFCKAVEEIKNNKYDLGLRFTGCESMFYGHYSNLIRYAGYKPRYHCAGIGIIHGVDFSESIIPDIKLENTFLFISQGNTPKICKSDKTSLMLDIGPFIHYAKNFYSPEEERELKKELGKTVLIYPTHSYEKSEIGGREIEKYRKMIEHYASDYDTVVLCVYWHDVLDDIFLKVRHMPRVKMVSCGLRSDENFLARTKSLMNISDLIVGTHIGTFIGYAIYMNKPIEYYDLNETVQDYSGLSSEELDTNIRNKMFVKKAIIEKQELSYVYQTYWGGTDKIRTKDEIAAVLELRDEIIGNSRGYVQQFNKIVSRLKDKYKKSDSEKNRFKYKFLEGQNGEFF